jgi:ubiquinone/menaquinone biosynthesis C-methylase UbiE
LQTDYLTWPNSNILSNIDASNLPFSNNQFDCAFSIDALHHISKPIDALIELIRVVKPGGKVILVEPYVSFLSYFVYKLFHEENTSWRYKIPLSGQTVSEEASAGEQGVLQAILLSKKILSLIQTSTEKELVFKKQYFSPVSFFATGGLTNPFSVSNRFIALLLDIEKKLPSRILKLVSARQIVVIKLKS